MHLRNEGLHNLKVKQLTTELDSAVSFKRSPFDIMVQHREGVRFFDIKTCSSKPLIKYGHKNPTCAIYLTEPEIQFADMVLEYHIVVFFEDKRFDIPYVSISDRLKRLKWNNESGGFSRTKRISLSRKFLAKYLVSDL